MKVPYLRLVRLIRRSGLFCLLFACNSRFDYGAPLAADSPWPKFRRDLAQTGRSPLRPNSAGARWRFQTAKGIFSTPVIDGAGRVYVGSADRYFYAINPNGELAWKHLTGEVIDSSALLDDGGRVIFGSGDGKIYALDAQSGRELWTNEADPPSEPNAIINWHEGNVAMLPDGTLLAGTDSFILYAIDRKTGATAWKIALTDQIWSCAAVDAATGNFFIGNNTILPAIGANFGAYSKRGRERWTSRSTGSIAASPLIAKSGAVVAGGFDGFVRAYAADSGETRWAVPTRDHIYASPAELSNGTIVQASTDGTVYALDPASGAVLWTYDVPDAVRSSPAIDGDDNIYFGAGNGALYALDKHGALLWAAQLEPSERNDLNASPALAADGIVIASESGVVHFVPYDWCKRSPRPDECFEPVASVADAELLTLTPLGSRVEEASEEIGRNEPLAFYLHVREEGRTVAALVDPSSLSVTTDPPSELDVEIGADGSYFTVSPRSFYAGDANGTMRLQISLAYRTSLERDGLRVFGGTKAGTVSRTHEARLRNRQEAAAFTVPSASADGRASGVATTWTLSRLAAPTPTILPSYNQIGFDSLNFLVSMLEWDGAHGVAWVSGAQFEPESGLTVADPKTKSGFVLRVARSGPALSFAAAGGFASEIMGATIRFGRFVITANERTDGAIEGLAQVQAGADCARIQVYGPILRALGLCNPETDLLGAYGAAELARVSDRSVPVAPIVNWSAKTGELRATIQSGGPPLDSHAWALVAVDVATGDPLDLDNALHTSAQATSDGSLASVTLLPASPIAAGTALRLYLLADGVVVATTNATVDL